MAALNMGISLYTNLDRKGKPALSSLPGEVMFSRFQIVLLPMRRSRASSVLAKMVEATPELGEQVGRRQVLGGVAAVVTSVSSINCQAQAAFVKAPKGYSTVLDNIDGYTFIYPFGWQEVVVKGQDVAFKDVIEPLESVSISIVNTDKSSLQDLGTPEEVAKTLVERVLASPTQKTKLVEAKERSADGKTYYTFEFLAKAPNYTRHALGTVAIADGKFYTLTTGANERRWSKMVDKLRFMVDSFTTL